MSFPRYPKYKNSGVEWLGDVPEHWNLRRLKFLCDIQTGDKDTADAVADGLYPFFVRSQTVERINSYSFDCEAVLTAGDGVGVGKVYHYHKGPFDFHQRVYMLNNFRELSGPFLHYFLRGNFFKVALEGGAKSTVDSLRRPLFTNFPVAFPGADEQRSIVRYLERQLAKLDELMAEQQRLIELLKEKRQAVISQAVTEGLNPHAPMKSSGLEWPREIPAAWSVTRLKFLVAELDGIQMGPFGGMLLDLETEETGFKVYGQENTISGDFTLGNRWMSEKRFASLTNYQINDGDLLLTRKGSLGNARLIQGLPYGGIIDSDTIRIRVNERVINQSFLGLLLHEAGYISEQISIAKRGAILSGLNGESIANLSIVLPPVSDQTRLMEYLGRHVSSINDYLADCAHLIDLLLERRSSLISAAVTGQIDVRQLTLEGSAA